MPENSLAALEYAYDTAAFGWRSDAQRILIVVTDACSHTNATYQKANFHDSGGITEPWMPASAADIIDKLQGNATVHVIAP